MVIRYTNTVFRTYKVQCFGAKRWKNSLIHYARYYNNIDVEVLFHGEGK